jgi:drug/metabolite transporter (DMT)-like permease
MDFSKPVMGGEFAALFTAFLWAIASTFFERAGKKIPSVELNLLKGLLGLVFLGVTVLLVGETFASLDARPILLLVVSGVVGIGLGDTFFFKALDALGPRRALLVSSLTPAITALIALAFLHEALSGQAWAGMLITLAGIAWVITERPGKANSGLRFPLDGVLYALLFAVCQAVGAVLSRAALVETGVSSLQSTLIRLCSGLLVLAAWIILTKKPVGRWLRQPGAARVGMQSILATFLGTYLGMWLQQTAYKLTPVGIAQTLTSTSPLFILPIAALAQEKISVRAVLGAGVAMAGIVLLFLV